MAASEEEQAAWTESTVSPRLSWTLFGQFNILESIIQLFWDQLVALSVLLLVPSSSYCGLNYFHSSITALSLSILSCKLYTGS
jgi:hypothetical protein